MLITFTLLAIFQPYFKLKKTTMVKVTCSRDFKHFTRVIEGVVLPAISSIFSLLVRESFSNGLSRVHISEDAIAKLQFNKIKAIFSQS